jgi:hypothetical protein
LLKSIENPEQTIKEIDGEIARRETELSKLKQLKKVLGGKSTRLVIGKSPQTSRTKLSRPSKTDRSDPKRSRSSLESAELRFTKDLQMMADIMAQQQAADRECCCHNDIDLDEYYDSLDYTH